MGRTIFGEAARGWLKGEMSDAEAVQMMAGKYARLCEIWDEARDGARDGACAKGETAA